MSSIDEYTYRYSVNLNICNWKQAKFECSYISNIWIAVFSKPANFMCWTIPLRINQWVCIEKMHRLNGEILDVHTRKQVFAMFSIKFKASYRSLWTSHMPSYILAQCIRRTPEPLRYCTLGIFLMFEILVSTLPLVFGWCAKISGEKA